MDLKKYFLSFVAVLVFSTFADSAPIVNDIKGELVHGNEITISGNGFGSKPNAEPLRFETFEKNDSGRASIVGNTVTSEISWWEGRGGNVNGYPKDPTISNLKKRHLFSGRTAAVRLERKNNIDFVAQMAWKNNIGFNATGKIYVNIWLYWKWVENPVYNDSGGRYYQVKAWNIDTEVAPNGAPVRPYISQWANFYYDKKYTQSYHRNGRVDHPDQSFYHDNDTIPPLMDGWINIILLSLPGTNDPTARIKDGLRTIMASHYNFSEAYQVKTEAYVNYLDDITKGVNSIDAFKFGWYLGKNLKTGSMTLYWDDIYLDNSWARVEIGDKADYDSCTHREIQVPSSWSENSTTVTVNQGSFINGKPLYLYVVDADGNVNDRGYPIVFGDNGAADPLPTRTREDVEIIPPRGLKVLGFYDQGSPQ
jgi:hypothetical protein